MKNKLILSFITVSLIMGILMQNVFADSTAAIPETTAEFALENQQELLDDTAVVTAVYLKVGQPFMTVNGETIEITAPYAAQNGVTLVPVRAISTVFEAEVQWNDDTQAILIHYQDVSMEMIIGRTQAEVNGYMTELPCAPELKDNTAMVPVRFIAELFGAEVFYEEAQQQISIVKQLYDGETVQETIDTPRVGNSRLGWSMNNPRGLSLITASPDGKQLLYRDHSYNVFMILSDKKPVGFDLNTEFEKIQFSTAAEVAVRKAEKQENHFKLVSSEDEDSMTYIYVYEGAEYVHYLIARMSFNQETDRTVFETLFDSFQTDFGDETVTHDFAVKGKDGFIRIENQKMKFSVEVPENWMKYDSVSFHKLLAQASDLKQYSSIEAAVYSKNQNWTAETIIKQKHTLDVKNFAPELVTVSEVMQEKDGYGYTVTVKGTVGLDREIKTYAFNSGGYVYVVNIILFDNEKDQTVDIISHIIDSITVEPLDSDKTGVILYVPVQDDIYETVVTEKWRMRLSLAWQGKKQEDYAEYFNVMNQAVLYLYMDELEDVDTQSSLKQYVQKEIDTILKDKSVKLSEALHVKTMKEKTVYQYTAYRTEKDTEKSYRREYYFLKGGVVYNFSVYIYEENYTDTVLSEIDKIVESFEITG